MFPCILQGQSWTNLQQDVIQKKVVDYGYGLWELDEKINNKYFNLNCFISKKIFFTTVDIERDNPTVLTYKNHKISIHSNEALFSNEFDTMSIDTISYINLLLLKRL